MSPGWNNTRGLTVWGAGSGSRATRGWPDGRRRGGVMVAQPDARGRDIALCGRAKCDDLVHRIKDAIRAEISEIRPELDKLRAANKERGRISTRLYLARLELRETTLRLQRLRRHTGGGAQHTQRILTTACAWPGSIGMKRSAPGRIHIAGFNSRYSPLSVMRYDCLV